MALSKARLLDHDLPIHEISVYMCVGKNAKAAN